MTVLPDDMFDDMSSLTFMHFAAFMTMTKLPSFQGLTNLRSLTIGSRCLVLQWIFGECNLEDRKCGLVHPVWGNPAVTCLASNRTGKVATTATLKLVEKFSSTICGPVLEAGFWRAPKQRNS
ncbi:hypothetical protein GQ600_22325 [Phytophthora cactorum]|nr:hypothetical protein GQ600_22325 [Phytophthora cactorum]